MKTVISITLLALLLLSGCGEKKDESKSANGMKCGAGKCGANMFDGNSALAKKKNNILSQMRENDSRKNCVENAKNTKTLYDCVREPNGKKLTMKCGTGKCGEAKPDEPAMKCGAGKCGSSMKKSQPMKIPTH